MKNTRVFLLLLVTTPLFAQGLGQEAYTLSPQPWPGDWLQERLDQMVHGEDFKGFPGPLPKMWSALGLDPNHPSVQFELHERVKRDSPKWFGTCNGWAAAATQFPEPEPMVINGVKFSAGEVKAILAAIWKDNVENPQGQYDSLGITAASFESVLYQFIGQNKPIIFDVSLGIESWNFPVVSFDRKATQNGEWVDVEVLVRYANAVPIALLDQEISDSLAYLDETYFYRYNEQGVYEWVGSSIIDRPQRAWFTDVPYLSSWYVRGNRHFNMATFGKMSNLAQLESSVADLYEPNQSREQAVVVHENLILGSMPEGDADFYRYHKLAGEHMPLVFRVYDGPGVNLYLRDLQGNIMEQYLGACELELIPALDYEGYFYVEITAADSETSFYDLQLPVDSGYLHLNSDSPFAGGNLTAINISDNESQFSGNQVQQLPAGGAANVAFVATDVTYRNSERSVWAIENIDGMRIQKRYDADHELSLAYVIPHLTCRNGWKTHLTLYRENDATVTLSAFGLDGQLLEVKVVPAGDALDLGAFLNTTAASQGTWIKLETDKANHLNGFVTYSHEDISYSADFDIAGQPRNGEMLVTNMPQAGEGWIGLALVNTSEVTNIIRYRLRNGSGDLMAEGDFELAPGHKWLGLPANLTSEPIGADYALWIFSTYNLETLALRHDSKNLLDYAHRLPNPILDFSRESYVSLPLAGLDTQSFYVTHPGTGSNYVNFRGIDVNGQELVFHTIGGRPMFDYDQRYFTMSQLFQDAGIDPDNHNLAYFKVTSSKPVLISELVGLPGEPSKTHVKLTSIFDNP